MWGTIWLTTGMSATTCLSLAACALEESAATALPQPTLWPSLSEMDTGTRSPITPASRNTAPINRINRLIVTLELVCHSQTAEVPTLADTKLENRIRADHKRAVLNMNTRIVDRDDPPDTAHRWLWPPNMTALAGFPSVFSQCAHGYAPPATREALCPRVAFTGRTPAPSSIFSGS